MIILASDRMKEVTNVYKQIDDSICEIYVTAERLQQLEHARDIYGMPDLQRIIPECDRFEELRVNTKKLLERFFIMEKEYGIPVSIAYRRFYKELT